MKMERTLEGIPNLFPEPLRSSVAARLSEKNGEIEEIRLRNGFPPTCLYGQRELPIQSEPPGFSVDGKLLSEVVTRASRYSAYAVQDQLRQGFLTIPGGHRLGVCGRVILHENGIHSISELQSLNLRIAHQKIGVADPATNLLWSEPGSALIVGSPGRGKTTVLRDLIRQTSDRFSQRVGLVDERGELAACLDGIPQLRIGRHTDVLSGCPKSIGIELLVRTMNPNWIAVDEISSERDADVLIRASYTGVRFLATAHVWKKTDLQYRPVYRRLLEADVFAYLIEILPDRTLSCERMKDAFR